MTEAQVSTSRRFVRASVLEREQERESTAIEVLRALYRAVREVLSGLPLGMTEKDLRAAIERQLPIEIIDARPIGPVWDRCLEELDDTVLSLIRGGEILQRVIGGQVRLVLADGGDEMFDGLLAAVDRSRGRVRIGCEDPDTRAIADRARLSYDETAEMLAGFRSALRRADDLPAGGDGR